MHRGLFMIKILREKLKSSVVSLKRSKNGTGCNLVERAKKTMEFYRNCLLGKGEFFSLKPKIFPKTQEESAGCLLDS